MQAPMQTQDHEQFAHAVLPNATGDEFARQEFVKSYKLHLATQISPNTKACPASAPMEHIRVIA